MIKKVSFYKNESKDREWFENWVIELEKLNGYSYSENRLETSLGQTQIYSLNEESIELPSIVIFPGFRTTSLIWDLDKGLEKLAKKFRVFLIETNGQPNLSDGNSPSIKSLDYGIWANEVLEKLNITQTFIAGASFGGLVCMKLALVAPEKITAAFLLNPGCFRLVSMKPKNMYYNLLPIFSTSTKNITKFLNEVIFNKPNHQLSDASEQHLVDYLKHSIINYKDNTEKPYYMGKQLDEVVVDTHLIVGTSDILIPYEKSVNRAKNHLKENLKSVTITNAGHGIETQQEAINKIIELSSGYSHK